MKTAKEMFERLGFKKVEPRNKVLTQIEFYSENYNEYIEFSKDYKEYYVENLGIDMDILKAIIKQCKELGWLDE